ncbi:hypothetical protein THAOC_37662, partial [Thalassiosira oceanica]
AVEKHHEHQTPSQLPSQYPDVHLGDFAVQPLVAPCGPRKAELSLLEGLLSTMTMSARRAETDLRQRISAARWRTKDLKTMAPTAGIRGLGLSEREEAVRPQIEFSAVDLSPEKDLQHRLEVLTLATDGEERWPMEGRPFQRLQVLQVLRRVRQR